MAIIQLHFIVVLQVIYRVVDVEYGKPVVFHNVISVWWQVGALKNHSRQLRLAGLQAVDCVGDIAAGLLLIQFHQVICNNPEKMIGWYQALYDDGAIVGNVMR